MNELRLLGIGAVGSESIDRSVRSVGGSVPEPVRQSRDDACTVVIVTLKIRHTVRVFIIQVLFVVQSHEGRIVLTAAPLLIPFIEAFLK